MAYLYNPHVTEVTVTIDIKVAHHGDRHERVTFNIERNGIEITNQLADTVLSAMHLAESVGRERETTG